MVIGRVTTMLTEITALTVPMDKPAACPTVPVLSRTSVEASSKISNS